MYIRMSNNTGRSLYVIGGRGLLKQALKVYIAELTLCFAILSLVGALKSKRIEYIIYIGVEFRKSFGMNFVSPFQPERLQIM